MICKNNICSGKDLRICHPAGAIINALMGGLFAVVVDNCIEMSIITGSTIIFIAPGIVSSLQSGKIQKAIKKILLDILK